MDKLVVVVLLSLWQVVSSMSSWDGCGNRLERALDSMTKDGVRRVRQEQEEPGVVYQRSLTTAPLVMTVTRVAVKLPRDQSRANSWARVERCQFEPTNNSLRSRVMLNDLTISGLVSLLPNKRRATTIGESCRMTLRLRRAGIDFITSPIARTRGQMRIRTESSFLEPRFASIYAYACRPLGRVDRQIKRQDKPPFAQSDGHYEAAEPRDEEFQRSREDDIQIANESTSSAFTFSRYDLSPTKSHPWITKLPEIRRRKRSNASATDFDDLDGEIKHQLLLEDERGAIDWQSKENVAREMEDVFLRGASEALTKYIERQLHPAIKETLMVSMGYTISYG
ncbi:uncharacterized protein LOC107037686 [Diachasma alloeum]|uniref:uncharacterized protein LOC107037686 n=1 Tax=Diachasma alloeum TaxID=454923 RepID=UPI0007381B1D|nr:uncharacterized protein LOC107037686 [Diachasma alloeum]